jgi:hypothetical protein
MKNRITLIILALLILPDAKAIDIDHIPYSKYGVVRINSSPKEIESAKQKLLELGGLGGGLLFDGLIQDLSTDKEGNVTATFDVEKVIIGTEDCGAMRTISVTSAPVSSGGIGFRKKAAFRVYAVKLNGRYQTWSATGTYELATPQ